MAQFDKISFGYQLFWFVGFFFFSYMLTLRVVLPTIYVSLRAREFCFLSLEKDLIHSSNMTHMWYYVMLNFLVSPMLLASTGLLVKVKDRSNLFSYVVRRDVVDFAAISRSSRRTGDLLLRQQVLRLIEDKI